MPHDSIGLPMDNKQNPEQEKTKKCPHCANLVVNDSEFCMECRLGIIEGSNKNGPTVIITVGVIIFVFVSQFCTEIKSKSTNLLENNRTQVEKK
jgi:hypothetical protein